MLKPEVIYEDDDVLVVNKPSGWLTQPVTGSVAPSIATHFAAKIAPLHVVRGGIVHRLDKDTSGILVLAKQESIRRQLQRQFKQRTIEKKYVALVHGKPRMPKAIIHLPISRQPGSLRKRIVRSSGKPAETYYEVDKQLGQFTLLNIHPKSGRTHQIRVHLAHLGLPIVGDALYGQADDQLERQFLHAAEISLDLHGQRQTFQAPLPEDLRSFLKKLS